MSGDPDAKSGVDLDNDTVIQTNERMGNREVITGAGSKIGNKIPTPDTGSPLSWEPGKVQG